LTLEFRVARVSKTFLSETAVELEYQWLFTTKMNYIIHGGPSLGYLLQRLLLLTSPSTLGDLNIGVKIGGGHPRDAFR
jgi:hypothetical protein